jgi:hypothetical protein
MLRCASRWPISPATPLTFRPCCWCWASRPEKDCL